MKYPEQLSEAEIAAQLYNLLRMKGFDARMEVVAGGNKRLDIVVFSNTPAHDALCIIEVKKRPAKDEVEARIVEDQMCMYNEITGLPVYLCDSVSRFNDVCQKVKDLPDFTPEPIVRVTSLSPFPSRTTMDFSLPLAKTRRINWRYR